MEENNNKLKVLIVDDDKFLLDMYSLKFRKAGLDVNTATGGSNALNKIAEGFIPDILILDLIMPSMSGLELLEEIKKGKLADDAVVVMLTNQNAEQDIERAKKMGVSGYIVKATTIPSEVVSEVLEITKTHKKRAA